MDAASEKILSARKEAVEQFQQVLTVCANLGRGALCFIAVRAYSYRSKASLFAFVVYLALRIITISYYRSKASLFAFVVYLALRIITALHTVSLFYSSFCVYNIL